MNNKKHRRVVFYSKGALSSGWYLESAEKILKSDKIKCSDVNDALELFNIKKYIDSEVFLKRWSKDEILSFNEVVKQYNAIIAKFLSGINDKNIISVYDSLSQEYHDSFWEVFNKYKIFLNISDRSFDHLLNKHEYIIGIILYHKKIVERYDQIIADFFKQNANTTEILLSVYGKEKATHSETKKYLPQSLSVQDKEEIISKYIDSKECNINYLRLLLNTRNSKNELVISDKVRLKAKRVKALKTDEIFKKGSVMQNGVSVKFVKGISNPINFNYSKGNVDYTYSLAFIEKNKNPYSLFSNFRILFNFVDKQGRITLVNKINQMGVMERILGISSDNEYKTGAAFRMFEMSAQAQTVVYEKILKKLDIDLLNILKTIFESIFSKKYNFAENAQLSIPTKEDISFFEKIRILAPEFESVLRQYKLFVDDGVIDFELLQLSSTPISVADIPSLVKDKYLYINGENDKLISWLNLFFSDQTTLAYVKQYKDKEYRTLFKLLTKEEVKFDFYEEYQKEQINFLINDGLLTLDENNIIRMVNLPRILLLKDLYENEVSVFHYLHPELKKEALVMRDAGMIDSKNTLFTIPEQNYFNYYLNRKEFMNGLDLRNRYLHGTQAGPDSNEHEHAYYIYIKLLVLLLLKIEDDLFLFTKIHQNPKKY